MVTLYTTHCPKCRVLEAKLNKKGIEYQENTDIEYMSSLGIMSVPVLEVDGKLLDFTTANNWINNKGWHNEYQHTIK